VTSRGLAVVTGASAGIGREFCEQLAARGHDLLLVARDAERLRGLARELEERRGIRAEIFPADLSREEEIERLAGRIASDGGLKLLVNNAGFGIVGKLVDTDVERQAAMVRLHALAPLRLTRAALPVLLGKRAGAIVNVSSIASFIFSPGNINYSATKAYLTVLTEGLAAELAGSGVQAQALCPGFTYSEFHQRMGAGRRRPPRWMWLSAEQVVRESLRCLDRRGPVICVPGVGYRLMVLLIRLLPRRLVAWLAGRRARDVT
jgi:short-subunit dehydrogenase